MMAAKKKKATMDVKALTDAELTTLTQSLWDEAYRRNGLKRSERASRVEQLLIGLRRHKLFSALDNKRVSVELTIQMELTWSHDGVATIVISPYCADTASAAIKRCPAAKAYIAEARRALKTISTDLGVSVEDVINLYITNIDDE